MELITQIFIDMGRPLNTDPSYICGKIGKARIYWRGYQLDLPGEKDSPESLQAFHQLAAQIAATGVFPSVKPEKKELTCQELVNWWNEYTKTYYPPTSKQPTYIGYAAKAMCELYADKPAVEFSPVDLKNVRRYLIAKGQCRKTVNVRGKQIVFIYKQAVSECLIDQSVWRALQAVEPIAKGREGSFDYGEVETVPNSVFKRTLEHCKPIQNVALRVQRLTGMRSSELLAMRPQDVDMTGRNWFYTCKKHKTVEYVGARLIAIPEAAAELLRANMPKTWADRWFKWRVDTHYKRTVQAVKAADMPAWYPHQLRHTLSTEIKKQLGDRAAQELLGHTDVKTTAIYAKATIESLAQILERVTFEKV